MTLDLLLAQGTAANPIGAFDVSAMGVSALAVIACVFLWRALEAANKRNDEIQEARITDAKEIIKTLTVPGGTSTRDSNG
jgi:membrane protein implicated in regulation of membrane protease activity